MDIPPAPFSGVLPQVFRLPFFWGASEISDIPVALLSGILDLNRFDLNRTLGACSSVRICGQKRADIPPAPFLKVVLLAGRVDRWDPNGDMANPRQRSSELSELGYSLNSVSVIWILASGLVGCEISLASFLPPKQDRRMATKEFYIRNPDETDSRGPFTIEQLSSLVEAGQVTGDTLYYEANSEQWIAIKDNAEVKELLYPEKKKLIIKKSTPEPVKSQSTDSRPAITVHDFLAAAEGKTDETKDKSANAVMEDRCAKFGLWGCILILLVAAAGEILPSIDVLTQFALPKLIANPLVILGVLDVALSVLLILGVVTIYPFVRFRALLGLGFMGFIYYTQGNMTHLAAAVAGSVGLYICTVFLSYFPIILGLLLGLGGMGALAYLLIL